ncbi:hypothetical protein AA23498_3039 [Acetobacter nitrogenifigens DSM 23921 = NBRC 105050]|uniref:Uncharacterized protein n=1 Tax=Acetobacter nitrogenifigens DSM 23921 = NBRC 105050 TaxID=1120919 RepID=A0A511X9X2_9PROT|nr:hypothetical protein [Acetobacter nitrogenifigens]GBQ97939.1 hypothetical protein AA23498_3039 [Acetobacter nitrogenifigens DSM 23921 = NBRC 105050]GEN59753.1 hypothetical protein ANI02nite_16370 [Acetobacter nitrogenifigens DSM 23921 = NBRC 105050]
MPNEPNYARRLAIIAASIMGGFALIVIDGWTLIYDTGLVEGWAVWTLHRLPLAIGAALLLYGFALLRKPVAYDPTQGPDDIDNIDGA